MEKIGRVSLVLKWVVWAFLVGLVVLNVVLWVNFDPGDEFYRELLQDELFIGETVNVSGSFWSVVLAFIASLPPTILYAASLASLARLFSLYGNGIIFTEANVRCMKRGGWFLFWAQVTELVSRPLIVLALTMDNPAGERLLVIGLQDTSLIGIVAAVAIILVSWVMDEGRKLREEQELVV